MTYRTSKRIVACYDGFQGLTCTSERAAIVVLSSVAYVGAFVCMHVLLTSAFALSGASWGCPKPLWRREAQKTGKVRLSLNDWGKSGSEVRHFSDLEPFLNTQRRKKKKEHTELSLSLYRSVRHT